MGGLKSTINFCKHADSMFQLHNLRTFRPLSFELVVKIRTSVQRGESLLQCGWSGWNVCLLIEGLGLNVCLLDGGMDISYMMSSGFKLSGQEVGVQSEISYYSVQILELNQVVVHQLNPLPLQLAGPHLLLALEAQPVALS